MPRGRRKKSASAKKGGGGRKRQVLEIEEETATSQKTTRRYRQKSEVEKLIVEKATERGLVAMRGNKNKMPDRWYPDEVARLKSDPVVAQLPFTASDIENKIRAMLRKEKKQAEEEEAEILLVATALTSIPRSKSTPIPPQQSQRVSPTESNQASGVASSPPVSSDAPVSQAEKNASVCAQVTAQVLNAFPNRCSYSGCGAPMHNVPNQCSMEDCTGLVHQMCHLMNSHYTQPHRVPNQNFFLKVEKNNQMIHSHIRETCEKPSQIGIGGK